MAAFAAVLHDRFVRTAVQHVRVCFPEDAEELGARGVEALVGEVLQRAAGHGFEIGEDLLRYLNLAVMLGAAFDCAPEFPWAARTLKNRSLDAGEKLAAMESEVDRLFGD